MAMTKYPPEYYDCIPFEKHPATSCPCLYHQIDGDALLKEAEDAENFETVERVLKTLLRAGGKTFEAQRTEAQRQEAQRMEVAEQTHWAYSKIADAAVLSRKTILECFPARDDWAAAHTDRIQSERDYCAWVLGMTHEAVVAYKRNTIELEYRRESTRLLALLNKRKDYTYNWFFWCAFLNKMFVLLAKGGPMEQFQKQLWVLIRLTEEAKALYDEFWELEDARGLLSFASGSRATAPQPSPLAQLKKSADDLVRTSELDRRCEANLEKLRVNLKAVKTLQKEIQEARLTSIDLILAEPTGWLGGYVAPGVYKPVPEDDPLWILDPLEAAGPLSSSDEMSSSDD